ncbi:hypothetical protein ZIOFF_074089 [Zingiber officinale]|uniref:Uncharacterized protein n=1 Tax=Zingiber officinale TaxID=94328 RepID=A0A8J5BCZ1_ZINOF|nr:hypothetical protein ZIOFF_074089 [Zingiber officinale]
MVTATCHSYCSSRSIYCSSPPDRATAPRSPPDQATAPPLQIELLLLDILQIELCSSPPERATAPPLQIELLLLQIELLLLPSSSSRSSYAGRQERIGMLLLLQIDLLLLPSRSSYCSSISSRSSYSSSPPAPPLQIELLLLDLLQIELCSSPPDRAIAPPLQLLPSRSSYCSSPPDRVAPPLQIELLLLQSEESDVYRNFPPPLSVSLPSSHFLPSAPKPPPSTAQSPFLFDFRPPPPLQPADPPLSRRHLRRPRPRCSPALRFPPHPPRVLSVRSRRVLHHPRPRRRLREPPPLPRWQDPRIRLHRHPVALARNFFLQQDGGSGGAPRRLDLKSTLFDLVCAIIEQLVVSLIGETQEQRLIIKEIVSEGLQLSAAAANAGDDMPEFMRVTWHGLEKRLMRLQRRRDEFWGKLIVLHRERRQSEDNGDGVDGEGRETVMDVMLSLQNRDPERYTDDIIKRVMMRSS